MGPQHCQYRTRAKKGTPPHSGCHHLKKSKKRRPSYMFPSPAKTAVQPSTTTLEMAARLMSSVYIYTKTMWINSRITLNRTLVTPRITSHRYLRYISYFARRQHVNYSRRSRERDFTELELAKNPQIEKSEHCSSMHFPCSRRV